MNAEHFHYLAAILFAIGLGTVLMRRNSVVMLMGVELMLNAANVNFVSSEWAHGQVWALFLIGLAASEVVVALAIVLLLYKQNRSIDLDRIKQLKG